MASISNNKGLRTIQFVAADGKRKSIRLGKVSKRLAEEIKVKVESLNAAVKSGLPIDGETAIWLSKAGDDLVSKLAKAGLCERRQSKADQDKAQNLLSEFTEAYIVGRTDHKEATTRNCRQAQRSLIEYFGAEKPIEQITAGDADDFGIWLRRQVAKSTASRRIRRCQQFFRAAVRKKLIAENPFADVKAPAQTNEGRKAFVTRETIANVIDAAPDAEWRLIIALARYAGVRTPSETLALQLNDINWERDRIRIPSPKTEHHEGGESRMIPIFPELRPYLLEVCELAQPGQTHLITRYRDSRQNLRTQFLKIIKRAGETPWPKPFHNLRASRQTELAETFPAHVVCKWMGNSQAVAEKHYLQVTEQHFESAAKGAALSGAVLVQKAVQQDARTDSQDFATVPQGYDGYEDMRENAAGFTYLREIEAPRLGLEPRT